MPWLIAGLGNPGTRYTNTAHNLGFEVVGVLARRHSIVLSASKLVQAETGKGKIAGEEVHLLLPTTFMNLSGDAVQPYAAYYKIPPANILSVTDDVAIPWGTLRMRPGGSHGGHNGLRSIIGRLGTENFPRLRVGCAPEGWKGTLADYVLARLTGDALELSRHMAAVSADAIELAVSKGLEAAQNKFNGASYS